MGSSPMEKIGECNGVTLYFADSRFERPGVYYWDGSDNVRAWPPEDPNPPQPSAPVGDLLALADEIDRQARECPTVDWRPNAHENARNLRRIASALTTAAGVGGEVGNG